MYLSPGEVTSLRNKSVQPNGFCSATDVPALVQISLCTDKTPAAFPRVVPGSRVFVLQPCSVRPWSGSVPAPIRTLRAAPPRHAASWPPPRGHPPVRWAGGGGGVVRWGGVACEAPTCGYKVSRSPASRQRGTQPGSQLALWKPSGQRGGPGANQRRSG